jgi:hypothetical protein
MTDFVWPFRPDNHMSESLEWLTHVIRARSAEQRLGQRPIPRGGYQHTYQLRDDEYGEAMVTASGASASPILVPDWPNHVEVPAMGPATVSLPIDASQVPAYKVGGNLIIWASNLVYEVRTISEIGERTIGIDATTGTYAAAPTVAPLRSAVFAPLLSADREIAWTDPDGYQYIRAQAGFDVAVTEDLTPDEGVGISYPTYMGSPVVTDPVELINGIRDGLSRELVVTDGKTSPPYRQPVQTTAERSMAMAWTKHSRSELWALRLWLQSRKGRLKNFWLPTWSQDYTPIANISGGDTYIEVEAIGSELRAFNPYPFDIAVLGLPIGSGGWFVRVTTSTVMGDGTERLMLSEPFVGSVDLEAIDRISYMTLSRFASDRLEIQHEEGNRSTVVVPVTQDPNTPETPS